MAKGKSLVDTKRENRVLIKQAIYRDPNASRTAIAKKLGLTLATLSTSVGEMIEEGILQEIEDIEVDGKKNAGRKAKRIGFCPDAAFMIGMEVTVHHVRGVLINIEGEEIMSMEMKDPKKDYQTTLSKLIAIAKALLPEKLDRFAGIGVGIPGRIDVTNGIIRETFFPGWKGSYPLRQDLKDALGVPVLINNNVNMRVYGYDLNPKMPGPDMFAYYFNFIGIICPIVREGHLMRGYTISAGEIGHNVVMVGNEIKKFNDVATEGCLLKEIEAAMKKGKLKLLKKRVEEDNTSLIDLVMKMYEEEEEEISAYVDHILEINAICIANVMNCIHTHVVVCDSHLFVSERSRKRLEERTNLYLLDHDTLEFRFMNNERYTGAKGAAYYVLKKCVLDR